MHRSADATRVTEPPLPTSGGGALQPGFNLTAPHAGPATMHVTKRSGGKEPVNLDKIVRAVTRCSEGLADVDPMRVSLKTIAGLYDGATTRELDELSIRTAASFIVEEPEYSRLAARLMCAYIDKEVQGQGVYSFSRSVRLGFDAGLVNERVLNFVEANARKLNDAIDVSHNLGFEYFGLRTLYDRYLLRHPWSCKQVRCAWTGRASPLPGGTPKFAQAGFRQKFT